ncbi:hypothetical protein WA538_004358, partial [Blastocystis sp. DL]
MNTKIAIPFVAACVAAGLYRLYNLNQFKKYSAAKLKDEQEAKQKAEYQKFLAERRRKRLDICQRLVAYIACFIGGYLIGQAESEFNHMKMEDGA